MINKNEELKFPFPLGNILGGGAHAGPGTPDIQEVLVEGPSQKDPNVLVGRSDANKVVHFKGDDDLVGKFVKIKISDTKTWTLYGEIYGS